MSRQLLLPSSGAECKAVAVAVHHNSSVHARLPQQCGAAHWPGTSSPSLEALPSPLLLGPTTHLNWDEL